MVTVEWTTGTKVMLLILDNIFHFFFMVGHNHFMRLDVYHHKPNISNCLLRHIKFQNQPVYIQHPIGVEGICTGLIQNHNAHSDKRFTAILFRVITFQNQPVYIELPRHLQVNTTANDGLFTSWLSLLFLIVQCLPSGIYVANGMLL